MHRRQAGSNGAGRPRLGLAELGPFGRLGLGGCLSGVFFCLLLGTEGLVELRLVTFLQLVVGDFGISQLVVYGAGAGAQLGLVRAARRRHGLVAGHGAGGGPATQVPSGLPPSVLLPKHRVGRSWPS